MEFWPSTVNGGVALEAVFLRLRKIKSTRESSFLKA